MKKIFTLFAAMLFAAGMMADCQDGSYGLQINGTNVVDAPKFGDPDAQGRVQYKASCVSLNAGDVVKLINQSCDATWMVDLDPYGSYESFTGGAAAGQLICNVAGNYDFYIKLSMDQGDLVYVGPGDGCTGGGDQGGQGGGSSTDAYWYWKGYVDGVELNNEMEGGLFECGMSEITVSDAGYVFVVYQEHGVPGVQYMTDGWLGTDITHATMSNCGICTNGNKLYIPAGTYTLYLYDNGDGTVELSRESLSGKKLMGCDNEGVENVQSVKVECKKEIRDGRLVIRVGEKEYDATGKEL